jgi:hypothetical protein
MSKVKGERQMKFNDVKKLTSEEQQAWSRACTSSLYSWLTRPKQRGRVRKYVQQGVQLVRSGRVRLKESTGLGVTDGDASPSEAALSVTATRLLRSFGPDSDCFGDLETWPEFAAFKFAWGVDFTALAHRLLCEMVPGYEPGEVRIRAELEAD